MPFILAALFYVVSAVYSDGSCLTMAFQVTPSGDCRIGAPEVWCPNPSGPCLARDHAVNADVLWPPCPTVSDPIDPPEEDIE